MKTQFPKLLLLIGGLSMLGCWSDAPKEKPEEPEEPKEDVISEEVKQIRALWKRYEDFFKEKLPEQFETLNPGASEEELARLDTIKVELPDYVLEFFRIHNGHSFVVEDFGEINDIDLVLSNYKVWNELLDDGTFEDSETEPDPGVKPGWYNSAWVPITDSGAGDNLVLDFDPAEGGTKGQVVTMWHDWEKREIVAPSLMAWFEAYLDKLERGEVDF